MSDEASESLAAARRVDARCDEFELALATGKSPQIESFLTDMSASERLTLLLELLGLELDFRVARGEQPKVGDYAKRFPDLSAEQLAALVEASRGRAGVIPSVGSAVPNAEQPTILSPTDAVELAHDASAAALRRVRYFGDYELLREIARGGMGVVYEARQRSLNRPVALKMILSGQLASAEEVARFRREAEAAAQLEHPGIVPIFEIGTDGDQHYFTMGYVSGPSLSARLLERPLEPREAATLIRDVALAVQYAHERGVVHRDLKPSNILLAEGQGLRGKGEGKDESAAPLSPRPSDLGQPRITDFGLAKVSHADHSLTETGQILGTPSYMPPEQASGMTQLVGPAADIYSLGAVLYACLTGRPPFQAASVLDTVRQVLERDPVSLRDLNAAIPQDLETICLKCLEKSIPRRYPTAKDVADELQRYLEGRPIEARPVSRRERVWRWCRRNPIVAGLSAAVAMSLLLGIAVSSYFAWQENKRAIAESDARRDEELQRRKADQQTAIAKKLGADNLKLAEDEKTARQKADLNADAAQQQTKLAKRHLYAAHMNLIQAAWDANRVGEAVRILELYRPAEGQADDPDDLRGFEWYYWDRCCQNDLMTLKAPQSALSVAFSPDGKRLAAGCIADNAVKTWDVMTGEELLSLKGHKEPLLLTSRVAQTNLQAPGFARFVGSAVIHDVAYSPDGQRLASASGDGTIKLWNTTTGDDLLTLNGHTYGVRSIVFSPDGQRLVSTASTEYLERKTGWEIKIWDATSGRELRTINGGDGRVWSAVFSPDGKRLISANSEKTAVVNVWDADSGEKLLTFQGSAGAFRVAMAPNGQRLATVGLDGIIKLWEASSGKELRSLNGRLLGFTNVAFSPDGERLVSASGDQTIKVWNVNTGEELLTLKGHSETVNGVAFSPNGKLIASASEDGTVKLWDATTSQERRLFHLETTLNHAFNGNGHFAAIPRSRIGKDAPRIIIGDATTGTVKQTLAVRSYDPKSTSLFGVSQVELDRDGQRLAAVCRDRTVRVFDVASGLETAVLQGHSEAINGIAFDPNGKRIVSFSQDRTVRVWDTTNGQETLMLQGHASNVLDVVFDPAGNWFASAGQDKTIRVWDAASGRSLLTLNGHNDSILTLAISPDGKRLASGGKDRTIRVWDVATGEVLLTLQGHTNGISKVAFSPDGKRMASSSYTTVKLWDAVTGSELVQFKDVSLVAFNPDGTQLILNGATPSTSSFLTLRDATPPDAAVRLATLAKLAQSAPLNQTAVTVEKSPAEVKPQPNSVQDRKSRSKNAPPPTIGNPVQAEKVPVQKSVLEPLLLKGHSAAVMSVVFSPNGQRVASASFDKKIKIWDPTTGQETLTMVGHTSTVKCVAFSPDGKQLASASDDQTVRVWDAMNGQVLLTLRDHVRPVTSVAFGPDGKRLASASVDQTVKVWDVINGQVTHTLKGHNGFVMSVAFSPDGKWLASASAENGDNAVKLWDATSGQETLTFKGHGGAATCLAFNRDGKRLVSAVGDRNPTLKVWDATSGQELRTLKGSAGAFSNVVFSPDGKWLASGCYGIDRTVKVWDATTGQTTLTLTGHTSYVLGVAFSPDGMRLASASDDQTVRVWDIAPRPKVDKD